MSATFDLHLGDCLEVMRRLPDASVDAVVTDPPYGLSFMGKRWDYDVPSVEVWSECLRVLKPGGHLLAFAGTRTQHRMAVRIEDAGFEIRDMIAWVYGSGFPKSHNLDGDWQGWGTALKPALEPITVARKPLSGTVAENVLAHGTGALNIDGCRVEIDPSADAAQLRTMRRTRRDGGDGWGMSTVQSDEPQVVRPDGRWPANLIHDGSEEVLALFPNTASGIMREGTVRRDQRETQSVAYGVLGGRATDADTYGDAGTAARFFYCAKATKEDRDEGLEAAAMRPSAASEFRPNHAEKAAAGEDGNPYGRWQPRRNHHPTVKPTDLMRYLCRLVTPPNGIVLDPFMGSGSTGKAARIEGFHFIGIEREADYVEIARRRIADALGPLFG